MGILDAFRLTAAPRFDFTQALVIELEGWFKSNATTGGTIIPSWHQTQTTGGTGAVTAVAGSYFMCQPVTTVGSNLAFGTWT